MTRSHPSSSPGLRSGKMMFTALLPLGGLSPRPSEAKCTHAAPWLSDTSYPGTPPISVLSRLQPSALPQSAPCKVKARFTRLMCAHGSVHEPCMPFTSPSTGIRPRCRSKPESKFSVTFQPGKECFWGNGLFLEPHTFIPTIG